MEFSISRHALIMIACCAVPLVLLIIAINFLDIGREYYWLIILLCPLMHFLMMRDMHKDRHDASEEKKGEAAADR